MSPSEIQVILQLAASSFLPPLCQYQSSPENRENLNFQNILYTSRGSFFSVLEAEASI